MLKTHIGRLRLVGMIEAVSYILLLGIAVPLKYLAGKAETRAFGEDMVSVVGMAHGVLFIAFGLVLLQVMNAHDWSIKKALRPFIATLIPFGPFVIDKELKAEQAAAAEA